MIGLWLASVAFGANFPAPYVGLPLDSLAKVGFQPPTTAEVAPDLLRYALPGGGLAMLVVAADEDSANTAFDGMHATVATHWPVSDTPLPGDRAVGDGRGVVLLRAANVVLFVRDPNNGAGVLAQRALDHLTRDPTACEAQRCRPSDP